MTRRRGAKHEPPQTTRARSWEFIRQANLRAGLRWTGLPQAQRPERGEHTCKDPFQSHDERVERMIRSCD